MLYKTLLLLVLGRDTVSVQLCSNVDAVPVWKVRAETEGKADHFTVLPGVYEACEAAVQYIHRAIKNCHHFAGNTGKGPIDLKCKKNEYDSTDFLVSFFT